ncbi:S8 family serine peptidase [Saccharothrix texasensis]|uniref:Subtilisin family serine protease n=1 Tax=Saccharothrix texasensis TaxID=103734 RepID=A0A3N1HF71_9PSEU|nr:S8 family serine peptidase [Saccharothrix texasensis]ROP41148.1 subtilisin family serine protease [Saccharothrix texasensis]
MGEFRAPWIRWARAVGVGASAVLVAALAMTPAQAAEPQIRDVGGPTAVPGSYIVVLKDGAGVDVAAAKVGARVTHRYRSALNGFAATMSEGAAKRLAADPAVAYVAQDQRVEALADQPNPPSWGLDRVDQRDLPLNANYGYATTAGNVHAYIIDTGIRTTHADFGGRASFDANTTGDGNNTDCNGHGTHVAGTVGGAAHGVAKGVRLHGVKVLSCSGSGTIAGVVAGVDWVTANAQKPAVANMSLGGGANDALDEAVRRSIASGVTYAVASGNSNANACSYSPARVAEAITVNAADSSDARATFSNWGTCTDVFAPGVGITSTWSTSDTATNTISGTSMASPHVAGAAALVLAGSPGASPQQVRDALVSAATPNKVGNPGTGSPNALLFTGSAPPPQPGADTLVRGESLGAGQAKVSQDGRFTLVMQGDGNLVLYTAAGQALWHTNTHGTGAAYVVLQLDGNLVIYTAAGQPVWHTNTHGTAADRLIVQNDSNVVLYGPTGQVFWHRMA